MLNIVSGSLAHYGEQHTASRSEGCERQERAEASSADSGLREQLWQGRQDGFLQVLHPSKCQSGRNQRALPVCVKASRRTLRGLSAHKGAQGKGNEMENKNPDTNLQRVLPG